MKRAAVALLLVAGFAAWALAMLGLKLATVAAVLAERLIPGDAYGNCWSYALRQFAQHGGYISARPADDVRLLGRWRVLHAAWLHELPAEGIVMQQYVPIERTRSRWGRWLPGMTIWYRGEVTTADAPHPSAWTDLG